MTNPSQHDSSQSVRLADLMRVLADELRNTGQIADGLQDVLSRLGPVLAADEAAISAIQSLDLLTQRLHGLTTFLSALAPTLPAATRCDARSAAQAVNLTSLAHRLTHPDCPSHEGTEAGEHELFG